MTNQTSQQLADVLLAHWQNLWPLPPAERMKRIDEIRRDHEYEHLLTEVSAAVQEPAPQPFVQPEPSNLLQFIAAASFVGVGIALFILAATPVPA